MNQRLVDIVKAAMPKPQPQKLCTHCKFIQPYPGVDNDARLRLARCTRSATLINLVNGETSYRFCENERMPHCACGPEGRNYEPSTDDINV